jgi:CspA family cold shock protein
VFQCFEELWVYVAPTAEDVFVYFSAIMMNGYKALNKGQAVEFEAKKGPRGLHAEKVTGF